MCAQLQNCIVTKGRYPVLLIHMVLGVGYRPADRAGSSTIQPESVAAAGGGRNGWVAGLLDVDAFGDPFIFGSLLKGP